jgi:hypothetical protein
MIQQDEQDFLCKAARNYKYRAPPEHFRSGSLSKPLFCKATYSNISLNVSSSSTVTPSDCALSNFEPAASPATT